VNIRTRGLCFEATTFPTVTQHIVVEHRHMAKFAGKTRFTIIQLPVDNDAQTQSPATINIQDVLFVGHNALHKLAIGHRSGIVVDGAMQPQFFVKNLGERLFVEKIHAVAMTGFGIHPSRYIDACTQNFGTRNFRFFNKRSDDFTELFETLSCIFVVKRKAFRRNDDLTFKIDKGQNNSKSLYVDTQKTARVGVESVHIGLATTLRFLFSEINYIAFVDELAQQLGNSRNA